MVFWKYCQGNGEMKLTCKIWINWSQKWVALILTGSLSVLRPWAQRSIRHENFRQIRKKKSYRLLIKWFVKTFITFVLIKRQNSNCRFRSKWVISLGHFVLNTYFDNGNYVSSSLSFPVMVLEETTVAWHLQSFNGNYSTANISI